MGAVQNLFGDLASLMESSWAQAVLAVLPVWIFGALVGLLLPRPKCLQGRSTALLVSSPAGTGLRQLALLWHAAVIVREVYRHFLHPGTTRTFCRAVWQWMRGKGFHFQWPASVSGATWASTADEGISNAPRSDWYLDEKDLEFFKYRALEDGPVAGASEWDLMLERDMPNKLRYTAWRRTLPDGKTEYKSVTVAPDVTAHEFNDMYFDDDYRPNWDGMVIHHEVLEHGDFSRRQQVVRWIRRFPFSFLSDREYCIARQGYKQDGVLYGLTKSVDHPRNVADSKVVKMEIFYSMWCCRDVPCPWGSGQPACETTLLHHEQFKIPENLARFSVRHGMWGFVKHLAQTTPVFIAQRRARGADPNGPDTQAYGAGCTPNPPSRVPRIKSDASLCSLNSVLSSCSGASSGCYSDGGASDVSASSGSSALSVRSKRVRGLAALALAGGVALLLGNSSVAPVAATAAASARRGSDAGPVGKHKHHHRHHKRHRGTAAASAVIYE